MVVLDVQDKGAGIGAAAADPLLSSGYGLAVKTHLIHIYGKLRANDRTAAVTVALERKILRMD
jgi:hypothetical protein